MLPYTMYFAGVVPLATVLANALLAVVAPVLMIFGVGIVALSWLSPIAMVFGVVASWIGKGALATLSFLSELPKYNTPAIPWWGVVTCYLVFVWVFFRKDIMRFFAHLQNAFLPPTN